MKKANIVLFKRFCRFNGINQLFAGLYKQFRFPESPEDIEEYLRKVDAYDVIVNAFKFPQNLTTFGPEYWLDVAVKWEQTLKNASESNYYNSQWDNPSFHRNDLLRPLAAITKHRNERAKEIKECDMSLDASVNTPADDTTDVPSKTEETNMIMENFEFFDFPQRSGVRKLRKGYISVNTKGGFRILFNSEDSKDIVSSGLKFVRIVRDRTNNNIMLLFNRKEGLEVRTDKSNYISIATKQFVVKIMELFDISEEYSQLRISKNLANSKDYITYRITKK